MIYVECKPDFILVRSITAIPKREIVHEFGKGNVCNRLQKQQNSRGLIDEDPSASQPPYLEKMTPRGDQPQQGLKVLEHKSSGNSLVLLCPTLEEWILGAAKEAEMDVVRKYGLPDDPVRLHRVINLDLDKFEKLVENLRDSRRLKTLSRLLGGPIPQRP